MDRSFTLDEARAMVPDVLARIDQLVAIRGRMTVAVRDDDGTPVADLKAMEAQMSELLDGFASDGLQVKGWAPVLLDFPMRHDGRLLLLCLLEGERELSWFHDAEHGFAGRRPIADLDG